MDQSAIKEITALAIAASGFATDVFSKTTIPTTLVPEGYKIESLEKYNAAPTHHIEHFKTKYIGQFIEYTETYLVEVDNNTTIFINERPMSALAIFDKSTPDEPRWQHHKATLTLENTPALDAILKSNNSLFAQQELIDFATDWREHIVFFDGDEQLSFDDSIARIRKLKITTSKTAESEQGSFKANRSAFEQIEIDAAGKPIPSHFVFNTPPYLEFQERAYSGQLRALGDENKANIKYRLMQLPAIEQAIAEEFKTRIQAALSDAIVYIGQI